MDQGLLAGLDLPRLDSRRESESPDAIGAHRGALFTTPLRRSGYTTVVRAYLFGVDADRKKPIDGYID